jgi:thiosulfate dehydrogenase [quinone] large subunit
MAITETPDVALDLTDRTTSPLTVRTPNVPSSRTTADWIWGVARIALGWIFLWPFLDKLFGLGYATASEDAWIDGGSPTFGFLNFGTRGPFAETFQSFAGDTWADWLFMGGLLGIGIALMAGVATRIATGGGVVMLVLMWMAALAPEHNPVIDDHIIYAIVLVGLAVVGAGDHLGLGRWWKNLDLVKKFPILK